MPVAVLQALGVRIYRVPDFHEWAAVAVEVGAVFLRAGLTDDEERDLLIKALDALVLPESAAAVS